MYVVEKGSCVTIHIPIIRIVSGIQKSTGGIHTHMKQHGDLISLLSFCKMRKVGHKDRFDGIGFFRADLLHSRADSKCTVRIHGSPLLYTVMYCHVY
jgi:hypothetical protein